jgi:hypothetical protein
VSGEANDGEAGRVRGRGWEVALSLAEALSTHVGQAARGVEELMIPSSPLRAVRSRVSVCLSILGGFGTRGAAVTVGLTDSESESGLGGESVPLWREGFHRQLSVLSGHSGSCAAVSDVYAAGRAPDGVDTRL